MTGGRFGAIAMARRRPLRHHAAMRPYAYFRAHPALQAVVSGFSQRSFDNAQAPGIALPARTDTFIEFYLAETYHVRMSNAPAAARVPETTLVAPHTRPGTELYIRGRIDTFTIHFTPTGCHRLFGCDLQPLHDQGVPAFDVLGSPLRALRDALAVHGDWLARVEAAQGWLLDRLARVRPADALDAAALVLADPTQPARLRDLAAQAGCSERHLTRTLGQRLGAAPRLYARIARFQAMLKAHQAHPNLPIAHLAQLAHYFDHAHLVRDCQAFTGKAPGAFVKEWQGPERAGL